MKKRILSLIMILMICIALLPPTTVYATSKASSNSNQTCSDWAKSELSVGVYYGIIPLSWMESDMTGPITDAQFRVLLAGIRNKILKTNCVLDSAEENMKLKEHQTVAAVLKNIYSVAASYTFSKNLILKNTNYLKFMIDNGIYTSKNGEQTLTSICSMEQACVIATRLITVLYDQLDVASKGFFYVTKANGNTVYMLGSIHMATTDIYPMNDEILKAYESSDALAVEINLYKDDTSEYLKAAQYSDGTTLKDHVSAETYQKILGIAKTYGIKENLLTMYKPWFLYTSLYSLSMTDHATSKEASQGAALGVDMNFLTNAVTTNKPILEVEGYGKQGRMLDSFSYGLQEFLLNGVLTSITNILSGTTTATSNADYLDGMLAAWKTGDETLFAPYGSFETEYKDALTGTISDQEKEYLVELKDKLFTKRDTAMADYIEGLLTSKESKTYFVVVGGFHYVSDNDIIDMLTKRGYVINQIK